MADEDIEIRFISTRAGSGGEESIEEIDELNERTDELRNKTDELGESTEELGEGAQGSAGSMDDLINIERAQVAGQLAEVVNRFAGALQSMASQLEGIDPEAADRLNDVGLAVQSLGLGAEFAAKGFAVGGAFGAALGGAVGLITGPVKGAFEELVAELDALAQAEANATKMIAEASEMLRLRNEEAQRSRIAEIFRREEQAIDGAAGALERQVRLLQTKREVEAAIAGEEQRQARLGGADETDLARSAGDNQVNQALADLRAQIDAAQQRATLAEERATNAALTRNQIEASSAGFTDADLRAAEQQADAARVAFEQAQAEAELTIQTAQLRAEQLIAEANTRFAEQASDSGDRITEAGEQARAIFDQAEQQLGGLTTNAEQFRARLDTILTDAIPDEQQADQIRSIIDSLRTTQESRDSAIFDGLTTVRDTITTQQQLFQSLQRDLQRQQEQINSLR